MNLLDLVHVAANEPALAQVAGKKNARLATAESARPIVLAALAASTRRDPIIVAVPTGQIAEQLHDDLRTFVPPDSVCLFPAWETLPFERVSPAVETMGRRMEIVWRLRNDDQRPRIVVASVRSLLQKLAPNAEAIEPIRVSVKGLVDIDELCTTLVHFGYRRETLVEHRGEFARRGAIVDIFSSTSDAPVRIDTWGDEVDRLTIFDVNDQRSIGDLDNVVVFPARELLLDDILRERARRLVAEEPWGREQWERLSEGQIFDGMESWLPWLTSEDRLITDVVGNDALIVLVDPKNMADRARDLLAEEDDLARALATSWARDASVEFPRLHTNPERLLALETNSASLTLLNTADSPETPTVASGGWGPISHDPTPVFARAKELLSQKWTMVLAAETDASAQRLADLLAENGLQFDVRTDGTLRHSAGNVVVAPLSRGFILQESRIAVIAESDLSGRRRTRRVSRTSRANAVSVFEDLQPGGYVVHQHHGVAQYEGMVKRTVGGVERDYLLLAYKGGDKLYVPTDHIGALRQYVGGETPTLNRMGGSDFARAKSRVRSAVREVAQELVVLYQRRVTAEGHAFAEDTPWQSEMESAFPFVETPDQMRAIDEVKADMERSVPMDRLICGDVGFGKTEVAVRAAFKAIQGGRQAAVLVPTTLLASQHANTFSERFAAYPIRVEMLSRFLSNGEARKVLEGLKTGEVDCVIGTHRLLQEGVAFKNLGLLVVDEEQRFGVQHKEAMKRLRTNVDVLTMSATPIPRTLEMSLVGIRDLSLLQTPPADRQPILTYVGEDSESVATEAIRRELLRQGQVFWVHNRVQSIEERAQQLRELVPEARIVVAHGQMDESRLEKVVVDFWEGQYDVLVCTTIIESGIDMPTVNTLVVERADLLGLGQLHQLRGRVGRGGQRAYAYLFHPRDKRLSEEAYERLRTIGESTELGSGFRIAMRDLEIRGAGNLLGEAQSGHIAAVGYDLYCQLVTEAVAEMKGEPVVEQVDVVVDLPIDAFLPDDYAPSEELRLEAYRRLADVTTREQVADIRTEWLDRFGPLPPPAENLLGVAELRAACHRLGLREVTATRREIRVAPVSLRASQTLVLRRVAPGAVYRETSRQLVLQAPKNKPLIEHLHTVVSELFEPDDE